MNFFKKKTDEKLCQNCKDTLKERTSFFYPLYKGIYAPLKEIFLTKTPTPLRYSCIDKTAQGRRPKMEDEHFLIEDEKGVLLGVLDGHNGAQVASFVKIKFLEAFLPLLEKFDGHVYEAFSHFFYLIQEEIKEDHAEWDQIGTTVVVCYIEKKSNYLYTATLGDSEANIYRPLNRKIKSLPLSPIRNWSTKRDFASAREAIGEPLPYRKNPKEMRHPPPGVSPHLGFGLNVSRALGDVAYKGVIHSPKVTVTTLLPGDVVLLACDGLKDFVSEKEVIQILNSTLKREKLAQDLVDFALVKKKSLDNITCILCFVDLLV